ncbi:MSI1 [Candida margitis]|uniref:MSI1 n=1 Tax=Candida margitis TaxID=1775924 RepID=UPI002226E99B|nr:MSI1 [Candida margitis]KAI5969393.1 MSI1 [Candida margitis]
MEEKVEKAEVLEEEPKSSLIGEDAENNYRVWKKNAPYLYDYLSTNSLLWPSLTVQFFPDITYPESEIGSDYILQRLLHGTFTLGQSAVDSISILQVSTYIDLNKHIQIDKLDYNPDKEEFEINAPSLPKQKVLQKINQYGDVNKLSYMPQNPNVIASANNFGDILIFERTKHKSFQKSIIDDMEANKPQLQLNAKAEVFAMDWNKNREGYLVAGNSKGCVSLYDLKEYSKAQDLDDTKSWQSRGDVNDIEWFPTHDSLFGSVDEAGDLRVQDIRGEVISKQLSTAANSIAVNPNFSTVLATGDSVGSIKVWDLRNFDEPVQSFTPHSKSITQLKWHPKFAQIIASSSTDCSVKLHNLSNKEEPTIFQHLGHMLGVNDFDWSCADDWMIASVADDNSLHVWKPSQQIQSAI